MKSNEALKQPGGALREAPVTDSSNLAGNDNGKVWKSLVWVAVSVAACLIVFERVKHFLLPSLSSQQHQAITIVAGTLAAVVGSYLSTRRLKSALVRHAQTEERLAIERNILRTVTDNIPDRIF